MSGKFPAEELRLTLFALHKWYKWMMGNIWCYGNSKATKTKSQHIIMKWNYHYIFITVFDYCMAWSGLLPLSFPVKHWGEEEATHLWSNRKCVGHETEVTEARGSVPAFCGAGTERNRLSEPQTCLRLRPPKPGWFPSNYCCLRTLIKVFSIVLMCLPTNLRTFHLRIGPKTLLRALQSAR